MELHEGDKVRNELGEIGLVVMAKNNKNFKTYLVQYKDYKAWYRAEKLYLVGE